MSAVEKIKMLISHENIESVRQGIMLFDVAEIAEYKELISFVKVDKYGVLHTVASYPHKEYVALAMLGILQKRGVLQQKVTKLTKITCEIPPEIVHFTDLEHLEIDPPWKNNQTYVLSEDVVMLPKLQHLTCSRNQMLELPQNFGALQSLTHLEIHNARALPESIAQLVNLKSLTLKEDPQLPPDLHMLTNLQALHLELPSTPKIPEWIAGIPKLKDIFLKMKSIETFDWKWEQTKADKINISSYGQKPLVLSPQIRLSALKEFRLFYSGKLYIPKAFAGALPFHLHIQCSKSYFHQDIQDDFSYAKGPLLSKCSVKTSLGTPIQLLQGKLNYYLKEVDLPYDLEPPSRNYFQDGVAIRKEQKLLVNPQQDVQILDRDQFFQLSLPDPKDTQASTETPRGFVLKWNNWKKLVFHSLPKHIDAYPWEVFDVHHCGFSPEEADAIFACGFHSLNVNSRQWKSHKQQILANTALRIWDGTTGSAKQILSGHSKDLWGMRILNNGNILSYSDDATIRIWNPKTGTPIHILKDGEAWVRGVIILENGNILSYSFDGSIRIWNPETGKLLHTRKEHTKGVRGVKRLDNGHFLSYAKDNSMHIWDHRSQQTRHKLQGHTDIVSGVLILHKDNILSYSYDKSIRIWNTKTGENIRTLKGHDAPIQDVRMLNNGNVLSYSFGSKLCIWDIETGALIHTLNGHSDEVSGVELLENGNILSYANDGIIKIWDTKTGENIRTLKGHIGRISGIAFPTKTHLLSYGEDGTFKHWNFDTGALIATSLITKEGQWAVFSPEGWFDGSKNFKGAHFVADNRHVIAFEQLRDKFYQPYLLERLTGKRPNEPLPTINQDKFRVKIPPKVSANIDSSNQLTIDIQNQRGGIGKIQIKLNGAVISTQDTRGHSISKESISQELAIDLSQQVKLLAGEENEIEVVVFNQDGSVASRGIRRKYKASGKKNTQKPNLYVLSIGTSDYVGDDLDLRFAAKDAQDFAKAMRLIANRELFPKSDIQVLATGTNNLPTKNNIRSAFAKLKESKPNDVVIVFLAGHGVKGLSAEEGYLYVTMHASSMAQIRDKDNQKTATLSSREIKEIMQSIPANKQVMILDTCAAGAMIKELMSKRDLTADQIRAIDKLQRSSGLHLLMGSAADAVSYEASQYGQGLLTYSLLEGMKMGSGVRKDKMVGVDALFSYAQDRVTGLARDIGGVQEPRYAAPDGQAFAIGQVNEEVQKQIPLESVKPRIIRPSFVDAKQYRDRLGLNDQLSETFRAEMDKGHIIFSDVTKAPNSCEVFGSYAQEKDLSVQLNLVYNQKYIHTESIVEKTDNISALLEKISNTVIQRCPIP